MTRTVRRIRHRSQITRDMILNTRSHTVPSKRKFEEDDDKAIEEEFDLDEEFE
jgi:hypothetical protein